MPSTTQAIGAIYMQRPSQGYKERRATIIGEARQASPTSAAFYDCEICGALHALTWDGDCREDAARFFPEQLDRHFGAFGWHEVDMPE